MVPKRIMPKFMMCAWMLLAAAPALASDSMSLNGFHDHALPVLVRVNAAGKVTSVLPAVQLAPRTDRLLRSNLEQMITRPAVEKGKPVSSQFVIQLALITERKGDGIYKAHFQYVSAMPVPAGSWYWVHINGHRLALAASDSGTWRYMRGFPQWVNRPDSLSPRQFAVPAQAAPAGRVGMGRTQGMRAPGGVSRRYGKP